MNIIFLDIDGVLTIPSTDWKFSKECTERLLSLVKSCNARIVICSSWKESCLEKTVRLLPTCLQEYIIDQTPNIPGAEKGQEVSEFIHMYPNLQANLNDNYVILDDEPERYLPHQKALHLVATNMYKGLSEENVTKAKTILKPVLNAKPKKKTTKGIKL